MLRLLEKFEDIIFSFNFLLYEREANISRLKIEIIFIDQSRLYVRDFYLGGGKRKYAFHWMDKNDKLLVRWDNTEHWPDIATYPHHKHVGNQLNIEASNEMLLEEVLESLLSKIGFF